MRRFLRVGVVVACVIVFLMVFGYVFQTSDTRVRFPDGSTLHVTIADTPEKQELGLGGRSGLAAGEGMLFIFPADGRFAFWMKDMKFSIDIVWIAADHSIVHVAEGVSPSTYPQTFVSAVPARYVLETTSGYMEAHHVKKGDMVRF